MSGKKGLKHESKFNIKKVTGKNVTIGDKTHLAESEKDLIDKLTAIKINNEKEGLKEIQAILEKRNLEITTNVQVHLNGQGLQIVIKSK